MPNLCEVTPWFWRNASIPVFLVESDGETWQGMEQGLTARLRFHSQLSKPLQFAFIALLNGYETKFSRSKEERMSALQLRKFFPSMSRISR